MLGNAGTEALARDLEENITVTLLSLEGNNIEDAGAEALAAALDKNKTLTSLNLRCNLIGNIGAGSLKRALQRNSALTSLDINDNLMSVEVKEQIDSLIERNKRLLKELQATALEQVKAGRVLLSKALPADNNTVSLANLLLEIREHIVKVLDGREQMTEEQQRLILNYAEGKIAPIADKLAFFKATQCDRIRKQHTQEEVEAVSSFLTYKG
jgi:Ran GTPase-activating protein (RanGAP) involved in mRNA processing and transport